MTELVTQAVLLAGLEEATEHMTSGLYQMTRGQVENELVRYPGALDLAEQFAKDNLVVTTDPMGALRDAMVFRALKDRGGKPFEQAKAALSKHVVMK